MKKAHSNNKEKVKIDNKNWRENNKVAMRNLKRNWQERNKEHKQERQLEWQRNNPDKMKKYNKNRMHKNHDITEEEWLFCKNYFDNQCAYCGLHINKHYIPFRGKIILSDFHKEHCDDNGSNALDNCIPACKSCNSQKWKFTFDEWYCEGNPKFSKERLNKIMMWLGGDYLIKERFKG